MIQGRLAPYGGLRVRLGASGPDGRGRGCAQMSAEWETSESGPAAADRTVLLIPGGLNAARSYAEVMAQPALAGVRLVAVTLPGHAGAPPPEDFSIETYARLAGELAADLGCDAVAGFSIGATVALEMAVSGAFRGPVVLLGISLSLRDEPAFLRALNGLGVVLGRLPCAVLLKLIGLATRQARVSADRRAQLRDDLRRNDPRAMREIFRGYLRYLGRYDSPAARLCDAGVPAWVVHAEKGDGGLTPEERRTLEACSGTTVVTIPGTSFFMPNDEPERVAGLIVEALGRAAEHKDRQRQ
jgi:pimeloyl-ACP methyl ester carboxylesterase